MAEAVTITKVIEIDVKASAAANAHLKQLADSMEPIKAATDKASGSLGSMLSMVRGFVGFQILDVVGGTVAKFASALQEASDKSRVLEERMKLVTGSSAEAGLAFQSIIDISVRQGRELDSVAKLYEKVQRNSEQLAISQKGVALVTEGVAASLRLSGAGTQEANAAMLQFAQALASGKLGGDEFRSLMENNSVLMQAFAKELNTTMGGLREMSKEGKLNAETLREAMLKVGEDGKNVMQRMIEQADKLPKTFAQAVNGAKAALVDLVNALQQSGEKTEGFFTRIVKGLTESIRQAAVQLRDYALINEEVAKLLDKQLKPKETEAPFESRYAMENLERKRLTEESLQRAQKMYDLAKAANREVKDWDRSPMGQRLAENILRAKGELLGVEKILARMASQDAGDIMGGGFTTGNVVKVPGKDDTKKGRKPDTAVDVIERIRSDLEGEALKLQTLIAGETKARSELEVKLADIDKVAAGKLSSAFIESEKASLRRQAAFNDELKKEADWVKQQEAAGDFMSKAVQASDERVLAKRQADIEKYKKQAEQDRLTQDPFIGADAEVTYIKSLMEGQDAEVVQILKDRITQIYAKAAKQLIGEKNPLKNAAELMADSFKSAFDRMENDLFDFTKSAKDILGDFVKSILTDFAKIQMKKFMDPAIEQGSKFLGTLVQGFMASGMGNVFDSGGVKKFAAGDVLTQPTAFTYAGGKRGIGGEAGEEAIMPLKRGSDGKLGVGATPVTVNVINNGKNTSARTEEKNDGKGGRTINVIVEDMIESSIGSGRMDSVMGSSFGVQRRGK